MALALLLATGLPSKSTTTWDAYDWGDWGNFKRGS
jgi:hypothetical protein